MNSTPQFLEKLLLILCQFETGQDKTQHFLVNVVMSKTLFCNTGSPQGSPLLFFNLIHRQFRLMTLLFQGADTDHGHALPDLNIWS